MSEDEIPGHSKVWLIDRIQAQCWVYGGENRERQGGQGRRYLNGRYLFVLLDSRAAR